VVHGVLNMRTVVAGDLADHRRSRGHRSADVARVKASGATVLCWVQMQTATDWRWPVSLGADYTLNVQQMIQWI
jgi:hypothetical protein